MNGRILASRGKPQSRKLAMWDCYLLSARPLVGRLKAVKYMGVILTLLFADRIGSALGDR